MPIFWRIVTFLLYSVRIILCLNQIKKEKEMDQMPACPKCKGEYVYHDSVNFVCPDCGNEWNGNEAVEADEDQLIVKDSNGNLLADGDDVLLIKDLKLKGSSEVLKKGTKFKNIRLVNGDHNVDCGKIMLKSEFLKKAQEFSIKRAVDFNRCFKSTALFFMFIIPSQASQFHLDNNQALSDNY